MAKPVHPKKEVLKSQDMDFEKEMQKSLKVIFQNIHALDENRNKVSGNKNDDARIKQQRPRQHSPSLPYQKLTSHGVITARQESTSTLKETTSLWLSCFKDKAFRLKMVLVQSSRYSCLHFMVINSSKKPVEFSENDNFPIDWFLCKADLLLNVAIYSVHRLQTAKYPPGIN